MNTLLEAFGGTLLALSSSLALAQVPSLPSSGAGTQASQAAASRQDGNGRRQRFSGNIYGGVYYSDNDDRSTGGSHVSPEAGVQLSLEREQGALLASINGDVSKRNHQSGSGNVDGALLAQLTYQLVPQRLLWNARDNFGQSLVDQRAIDSPDNRQNFNYFTTGPSLVLPFSERTSLTANAEWGDVRYRSSSGLNNQRYSGSVGLSRAFGVHGTLAIEGSGQNVRYNGGTSRSDFNTRSVALVLEAEGLKTRLHAQAGQSRLTQQGQTQNEPLYQVRLSRDLSAHSVLSVEGGQSVSDTADNFARQQSFSGYSAGASPDAATAGAFRSTRAAAMLDMNTLRTSLSLSMHWEKEKYYGGTGQSLDRTGPGFQISRQLSAQASLDLHGTRWRNHYESGGPDQTQTNYGIGLSVRMTEKLALNALVDHFTGGGLAANSGTGVSYGENQASLRLNYQVGR